MQKFIHIETRAGELVSANGHTLTPFAQSIRIQFPGLPAGLIYNRPVSILDQDSNGQERTIAVHDITREVQWTLLGASLISMLFLFLFRKKVQKSPQELPS